MPLVKERNAEPIPGYRLLDRLGSGGFGEVWKCEAPGGLYKAIKFVYGNLNGLESDKVKPREEWKAIELVKAIRHPFLLSMDRVEHVAGELLIVTELADKNLFDLLEEYRQAGRPGIPREELIGYLREAAEALDLLNVRHGLQHLDVKPHNLFLVSNHVKVADFGLVSSLGSSGESGRVELGAITPLYASPEVFQGSISRQSDQYSLAVVYQELLTGVLPFQGKNTRQMLLQHTQAEPNLGPLPEMDRPAVARALAKDPAARFATCLEFVRALAVGSEWGVAATPPSAVPAAAAQRQSISQGHTDPDVPPRSDRRKPAPPNPRQEADTDSDRSLSMTPPRSAPAPSRSTPPIPGGALPGYRFLQCLGSSPLLDSWQVQAPDGRQRLVQLVHGVSGRDQQRLEEAVTRFRLLLHPAVAQSEVVYSDAGRLVLVTDLHEEGLRDRFARCQTQELPGIPREELLGYVRTAAGTLDYLYQQHSVQHLGLNPRSFRFDGGRLVIAEFGLAQLFWLAGGQQVAQRNGRYSAPELFTGSPGRSDQFSLAVIYTEMLTGCHPWRGHGPQGAVGNGARPRPTLDGLPARDREVMARALSPDPVQRFQSCTDMVRALAAEGAEPGSGQSEPDRFSALLRAAAQKGVPPAAGPAQADSPLGHIIARLVASAGGTIPPGAEEGAPMLLPEEGVLQHRFSAGIPLGSARLKLESLRQQWYGQLIRDDEQHYVFHVSLPAQFWRQWIGRQPGLEVQVSLTRQHALAPTPIDVSVQVRAFRCNKKRGVQLLEDVGVTLLDGLRSGLLVNSEKRIQDRLQWAHPLQVRPVLAGGTLGEPIACRGKDISLGGIGFYLPRELPTSDVSIELPATGLTPPIAVPATLVRAQRCADGWYEVGALFRLTALRKSLPECCLP